MIVNKNKTAELYLLQKMPSSVQVDNEKYTGPVKLAKLSTESYNLMEPNELGNFFTKVVSVAKFIISNLEDAVCDDKVGFINSLLNIVAPERSPETEPLRKSRRLIKDSSSR